MVFLVTWEELALFLKIDKGHSQKVGAVQSNKSRFHQLSMWFTGKEWNRSNFRTFLAELQERKLGQESLNKFISLGRHIDELLGVEETKGFKSHVPKLTKIENTLSATEIKSLAELKFPYKKYCDFLNKRQHALIMLMGLSGCRISETLDLKWECVKEFPRKHLVFLDTKNGTDREVWLDDDLWNLIQALPRKNDFVFPSARGTVLRSGDINIDLKRRANYLGIKKRVYNHLFRHSFATTMSELGVSDSDICQIVGWKDPKMLMRYKNSQLDHFASLMQIHPLLNCKASYLDRSERLLKEIGKLFDPSTHTIHSEVREGRVMFEIMKK